MSKIHLPETLGASTYSIGYAGKQVSAIVGLSTISLKGTTPQKIPGQGRLTLSLAITALFASIGNNFCHGFNTGVLNSPSEHIKAFLNSSYTAHYGEANQRTIEILWSVTVSIYLIGGCAGAFSAGALADRLGRKKAILLMAVPGLAGDILFGFCKYANSLEMLIIGRILAGFSSGAGTGLVPMYLTEIAPVNIRGAMGVFPQLGVTCGILISQLLGLRQLLGSADWWPFLLASSAVPYIMCCVVLPFYPDSPRWLLVKKGNKEAAEKALQRFRGEDDVEDDIQEMNVEIKKLTQEKAWGLEQLFRSKPHRIPLMCMSVVGIVQQLSGINMVFYYSDGVFKSTNIPADYTQYATLGMGFINMVMTIVSIFSVEKAGRRPLLLGGMIVMAVSLVAMTIALVLQEEVAWLSYISIVTMVAFVIGFAIGLGPIPQFIGAELFQQGPRPAAMSFAGLLNWTANFIVGISFPFIQIGIKQYCMLFFIVFLTIFGLIIWKYLPETKNKTFAEIADIFGIKDDNGDEMKDINDHDTVEPESGKPLLE